MTIAVRWDGTSHQRSFGSAGVSEAATEIDRVFTEGRALEPDFTRLSEVVNAADEPLALDTVRSAIRYLQSIYARTTKLGSWNSPHMTLSENSEIVFEWWYRQKKITLYFGEENAEYIKVWGTDIDTEMDSGPLSDGWVLTSLWLWLKS